jgi:hypothetical protein
VEREELVVSLLSHNPAFQRRAWEALGIDERINQLQTTERLLCAVDGRPCPDVDIYPGLPGDCGYYDEKTHRLLFGSWSLQRDDAAEVLDTLLHEDRHAYQYWAVAHPGFHSDADECEHWRENFAAYVPFSIDPVLYMDQPIEQDSRSYAQGILTRVFRLIDR